MKKKRQHDAHDDGNWTDSCDEDAKSPNAATSNCQHVKKSVDTTRLSKQLKATGLLLDCNQCSKQIGVDLTANAEANCFEYDNTLWLCLKCGTQLCGRSKHQHALQHYKTPHSDSHALTMNTRSFEIWCYDCDNEVSANTRRNLLECVKLVKKLAQEPPAVVNEVEATTSMQAISAAASVIADSLINNTDTESKIIATWEKHTPLVSDVGTSEGVDGFGQATEQKSTMLDVGVEAPMGTFISGAIPLPPPPQPFLLPVSCAKRINDANNAAVRDNYTGGNANRSAANAQLLEGLPRVRGLTNLGNTCFFNAVMQCLAQTPFLLEVLKELAEPGEEFILPGGKFKFKDKEDIELPMIKGSLSSWGGLTAALAQALEELQSGGAVFTPSKLFDKLCSKCTQFTGGDQHDSHELLRQLLESVRSEDLKRYQRVILQNLGYKDQDINSVSEEMRQKCKIYGNQAADRILRPEQVFRGFLVSTLTCQDCYNVSSRHEYFLDMSLPVTVEKPPPPQRRKASPEVAAHMEMSTNGINTNFTQGDTNISFSPPSFYLHPSQVGPTKSQMKKDKKERKAKRAAKHQQNKQAQRLALKLNGNGVAGGDCADAGAGGDANDAAANATKELASALIGTGQREDTYSSSLSTSEHSDADVEDNLVEDTAAVAAKSGKHYHTDSNGNKQQQQQQQQQPSGVEKRDDTPENMDKDSLEEEDENDSGIATSPSHASGGNTLTSNTHNANVNSNGISGSGSGAGSGNGSGGSSSNSQNSVLTVGLSEKGASLVRQLSLGEAGAAQGVAELDQMQLQEELLLTEKQQKQQKQREQQLQDQHQRQRQKRVRTQSHSDWSTTIAPRYQCDDGECSVQSCLNNFTAVELMTGNNKVGCESCTKRINGDDPKAKTVNTNATKQFLISSPPAVLILHLKRFQLGPRCIFRKLFRAVSFPLLLDIAHFCGSKVKNLPNIDRKQKKLLYALYGIVEHSGGMYGGHYTAYVKVRPKLAPDDKRWKFLPHGSKAELDQDDEQLKKLEELLAKEKARELRLKAIDDSDDFTGSSSSNSDSSASSVSDESSQALTHEVDDDDDDDDVQDNDDDDIGVDDNDDKGNEGAGTSTAAAMKEGRKSPKSPKSPKAAKAKAKATATASAANTSTNAEDEAANVQVPVGKWYYVSDSRVQEVNEETVLKSQAYLLFYERIY